MNWSYVIKTAFSGRPRRAWRLVSNWRRLRNPTEPLKLHLGCGKRRMDGYVNVDSFPSPAVDCVTDVLNLPCPPESVTEIISFHMIEHISHVKVPGLVKNWYRALKPGGKLVLECPDFDAAIQEYVNGNEERLLNVFGRQRWPGDAHLWGYNSERLKKLLEDAGFDEVTMAEPQDYHVETEPCLRVEASKATA